MSGNSRTARVLLIDDDDTFRKVMAAELTRRGYIVAAAATGLAGLDLAAAGESDVILLDLRLPDLDGIEVLKRLGGRDLAGRVVLLTGHGTIDTAIQAIRLGAYDYLEKPCPLDQVEMAIQQAHEHLRLVERQRVLEDGYAAPDVDPAFVGASPAFAKIRSTVARIAATDSTAMILGETGVGKEMVATLLHAQSARRDAPFVVMDCASLHENLLQSELFGHEKGAFTGAMRQKHGLFEVAHGGTLFLDEVGETSPEIQAQLLRVLETGRFRRVGGTREIAVDVRLISATNRNLKEAIARGHFREDLFFRLATLTIEIPPLRERREDIPLLVAHFTRQFNERFSHANTFSAPALEALARYRWPGNVRELVHVVEQSMVLCPRAVIGPEDLPAAVREGEAGGRPATPTATARPDASAPGDVAGEEPLPLREVERRYILSVVERAGGNRAQAARILQISERNLYRLLNRYGWSPGTGAARPDNPSTP